VQERKGWLLKVEEDPLSWDNGGIADVSHLNIEFA
jgi:hypothetical protein